jgi:hypothetical protein
MQSPLSIVKDKFGDKEKLVAAVEKFTSDDLWVSRVNAKKGLAHVSNAKLLRLHRIFSEVKEKFGTRDKLIGAILELEKRTKDEGYKSRLAQYPVPRLYDMYKSTSKRLAQKAAAPKVTTKAKPAKKEAGEAKKPASKKTKAAAK